MPNNKESCKYLGKWCAALDNNEQYQKFKVYRDKILALGNYCHCGFALSGLCGFGFICSGCFKAVTSGQQSGGHEEKYS
jgi:hypothetical protein